MQGDVEDAEHVLGAPETGHEGCRHLRSELLINICLFSAKFLQSSVVLERSDSDSSVPFSSGCDVSKAAMLLKSMQTACSSLKLRWIGISFTMMHAVITPTSRGIIRDTKMAQQHQANLSYENIEH